MYSKMVVRLIGPELEVLSSWIMTFWSLVEYRVWVMSVSLLFCYFWLETIVNSLSLLSLRKAIFSASVRPFVRSVLSIILTGSSLLSATRVKHVSSIGVVFCFGYVEGRICWKSLLDCEVGGLFEVLFGFGLLVSKLTMDEREVIWFLGSLFYCFVCFNHLIRHT